MPDSIYRIDDWSDITVVTRRHMDLAEDGSVNTLQANTRISIQMYMEKTR